MIAFEILNSIQVQFQQDFIGSRTPCHNLRPVIVPAGQSRDQQERKKTWPRLRGKRSFLWGNCVEALRFDVKLQCFPNWASTPEAEEFRAASRESSSW